MSFPTLDIKREKSSITQYQNSFVNFPIFYAHLYLFLSPHAAIDSTFDFGVVALTKLLDHRV